MLMKARSCVFLFAIGERLYHNVLAAEIQRQIGEIPPQITPDGDFWMDPFIEGTNPFHEDDDVYYIGVVDSDSSHMPLEGKENAGGELGSVIQRIESDELELGIQYAAEIPPQTDISDDDFWKDFHYSPESVLNQFFWSVDDDSTADNTYESSAPLGDSVQLPSEGTEKKNELQDDYVNNYQDNFWTGKQSLLGDWFPFDGKENVGGELGSVLQRIESDELEFGIQYAAENPPQTDISDDDFWIHSFFWSSFLADWMPFDFHVDWVPLFWSVDDDSTADNNYKSSAPLDDSVQLPPEGTETKNELQDDYVNINPDNFWTPLLGDWFPYGVSDGSTSGDTDKSVPLDYTAVQLPLEVTEDENTFGTVEGGFGNEALGSSSFVAAGGDNIALGRESFIGAGVTNEASGDSSFIGAGDVNLALGMNSFIGSGLVGEASGDSSFIGSGALNIASGKYSFIGGGYRNVASGFASTVIGGIQNFAQHDNSFVFGGTVETHCTSSAANQFKVCSKEAIFENVVVDGKLTLGPFTDVAAELEDALARADLALRCALISLAFNIALWFVVMLFLAKQLRSKAMKNVKRKEEPSLNDYTLLPNEKQDSMKEALIVGPISQMELESGVSVHGSDPQEHLIQAQIDNSSYSSRHPLTGVSFNFTPNQVDVKL